MDRPCPRIVIAALRGGAGKTTISVGLAAAWRKKGMVVVPFKKGPDYIDAAWLSRAASVPCSNLDTFLMGPEQVVRSFSRHAREGGLALIEGNRGLFDGVTADGQFSTAELAKLLHAPVIVVVDCDKVTRTASAMVLGCRNLDCGVDIRGVILNRVSGARHAAILRQAIENDCGLPVFGTVPRMKNASLTERHLGLIPPEEHRSVLSALEEAGTMAEDCLDMEGLLAVAESAPSWKIDAFPRIASPEPASEPIRVGVIQDAAFQFYYHENVEALIDAGARIVRVSALDDRELPEMDVLYIGGGFPETQAGALSENGGFRRALAAAAEKGLPIYAECGGFMYLGESLTVGDCCYPMVGALPITFGMERRPQGHGYTLMEVDRENPFFPVGVRLRGHEFHYSRILSWRGGAEDTAYRVVRGRGMDGARDGMFRKNILAGFTHLHAIGTPEWAKVLIGRAKQCRAAERGRAGSCSGRMQDSN